jgi:hypothetical protein
LGEIASDIILGVHSLLITSQSEESTMSRSLNSSRSALLVSGVFGSAAAYYEAGTTKQACASSVAKPRSSEVPLQAMLSPPACSDGSGKETLLAAIGPRALANPDAVQASAKKPISG